MRAAPVLPSGDRNRVDVGLLFRLRLRQAEGSLTSIGGLMGLNLDVPDQGPGADLETTFRWSEDVAGNLRHAVGSPLRSLLVLEGRTNIREREEWLFCGLSLELDRCVTTIRNGLDCVSVAEDHEHGAEFRVFRV